MKQNVLTQGPRFVNGIDTGIIASTIAQKTFKSYMYGATLKNVSIQAGVVSGYYAGSAVGSAGSAYCMDKIDRKSTHLNSSHSGESRMPSSA